ncbi:MAG: ester cyclase, partial [Myxococcales bacterium]|nr:ester cyclase [Myxococcales bacterium]
MRRSLPASRVALLSVASLAALGACTSQSVTAPPLEAPIDWRAFEARGAVDSGSAGPTPSERATAGAYTAAIAAPGLSLLGRTLDRDAHFAFPGLRDARGRESVVAAHEALFGAFDPRTVTVSRVLRNEGAQAVEWALRGTETSDWMGVPATH